MRQSGGGEGREGREGKGREGEDGGSVLKSLGLTHPLAAGEVKPPEKEK